MVHRHPRDLTAAFSDLVLDAVEDLSILIGSWSQPTWLLLAHAASAPVEGLDQARAFVLAHAAMLRRLPLHTYAHARLTELLPDHPDLVAHHPALSHALNDACLAMIMSDSISPDHYRALLAALNCSIAATAADPA